MQNVVAAIIPGILGSALYHNRSPQRMDLWTDDLYANYRRLCAQPYHLDWNGAAAQSSLLTTLRVSSHVPFIKRTIYAKLIAHSESLPNVASVLRCSYDWRDSVLNSSATVAGSISQAIGRDAAKAPASRERKALIIAHSLGGLVVKAAIAYDLIHPDTIDRLILIGTPQLGSPAAFRSMFSDVELPFFNQVATVFRSLGKRQFKAHLLRSFRTFPSLNELLPERSISYLCYSDVSRVNPLNEAYLDTSKRESAIAAHEAFAKADSILEAAKVPTFSVYTETSSEDRTDHAYLVRAIAQPSGYEIESVYHADFDGDGTVPAYSARGKDFYERLRVVNCKHALMCDSDPVLDKITVAGAAGKTGTPHP